MDPALTICSVLGRFWSVLWLWQHLFELAAPVAACKSIAEACCSCYSVWEQCRNVRWLELLQFQRPGAMQERPVVPTPLLQRPREFQACGSGSTLLKHPGMFLDQLHQL